MLIAEGAIDFTTPVKVTRIGVCDDVCLLTNHDGADVDLVNRRIDVDFAVIQNREEQIAGEWGSVLCRVNGGDQARVRRSDLGFLDSAASLFEAKPACSRSLCSLLNRNSPTPSAVSSGVPSPGRS